MTADNWVKVAHLLVLAVWFGTDIATFTLSRRVVDAQLSSPVRLALAKAMTSVEIFARLSLPTMLATGVFLAQRIGLFDVASAVGWAALVGGTGWVALIWAIHRTGQQGIGSLLTMIDLGIRSVLCLVLWILAILGLVSDDALITARWLAVKVALMALIMTCGIAIRFALRPFGAAFSAIVGGDPSPLHELHLQRSIRRAQPFVAVIWSCLIIAVVMAVARPALGQ